MTLASLVTQAFPSPEWAVFFEVSASTGFGPTRRADAIALGVWPSRGSALIGFEFKEDRRDWLREKKDPAKAERIASICDRWYVVAGADKIVLPEELPDPWGLMVASPDRTKLLTKKPAVPFPDRDTTSIKRSFVAAMLRKVTETTVPRHELRRLIDEAVEKELARTREGYELKLLREQCQSQANAIQAFEAASGVNIQGWRGTTKIGEAVAAVLDADHHREQLGRTADQLERSAKAVRDAIKVWPTSDGDA